MHCVLYLSIVSYLIDYSKINMSHVLLVSLITLILKKGSLSR